MSDTQWARILAVLETVDPAPAADARALFDAIIFRALTDTAWDGLPPTYPPSADVQVAVRHWRALGVFRRLTTTLPILLDR
jgi:transposase